MTPRNRQVVRWLGKRLPRPARSLVRSVRASHQLRRNVTTVVQAGAFDRDWYEAQTGVRFASVDEACTDYLRSGRRRGHSPHPLFEPRLAAPANWHKVATDPLISNLQGSAFKGAVDHPALPAGWLHREAPGEPPRWLAWARAASFDTPMPTPTDAFQPSDLTWREFRSRAIQIANELRRMGEIAVVPRRTALPPGLRPLPRPDALVGATESPIVSIIMATWNRGPVIRAAIESAQQQTFKDWELIVVDDGSDDDTLLVLEGLARRDPRIRVVAATHGGVCRARNLGVEHARGRYVTFLDSDNTWSPGFLAAAVSFVTAERVPWAHAALELITETGSTFRALEGDREHLLVGNYIDLNTLIVSKEALISVGGFDETLRRAVDYDLVLRLSELAPPRLVPVVGAVYDDRTVDATRISVAEPVSWNHVVRARHLVDMEAAARRASVQGRVSVVLPVRRPSAAFFRTVDAYLADGDVEVVLVVSGADAATNRAVELGALCRAGVSVFSWPTDLEWAAAINVGAAHANGEYLVLGRPNCLPEAGWRQPLIASLADPGVAIAQPLGVQADGRIGALGAMFVDPDPFPSSMLSGFPVEDVDGLDGCPLPAALEAPIMTRRETFWRLGGLNPLYGNAFGEVDLSLRARAQGQGVTALSLGSRVITLSPDHFGFPRDLSASAKVLRSRHQAAAPGTQHVLRRAGFAVAGRRVYPLPTRPGAPIQKGVAPRVRPLLESVADRPAALRWAIDTAAPSGSAGLQWGDWHFAQSLAIALRALGQRVHVDNRTVRESAHRDHDDVTLVLRGLDRVEPRPGSTSLMWIISHPDEVSAEECAAFDRVFAASMTWSARVSHRWGIEVEPLLQCTDSSIFKPDTERVDTGDEIVFVGNSRNILRPMVKYALDAGLKLRVYGGRWHGLIPDEVIEAVYVPNKELPALYGSAGAVLNDHWDDMRHDGFISNRVFDVLAAGGRLVSDDVVGLAEVAGSAVQVIKSEYDMVRLFTGEWRSKFPANEERLDIAARVREEHSFDARARVLLDAALRVHAEKRSAQITLG